MTPQYIFEVSWEVCNKVGGIYTVITSKAPVLQPDYHDRLLFIGPDVWKGSTEHPDFAEDRNLLRAWREQALADGLKIRVGRWNIPGKPMAILVDFTPYFSQKNEIFADLWIKYKLDSLTGQWDYIEPALFGYAAGLVIESYHQFYIAAGEHCVAQFHEWMTGTGALYLHDHLPEVGTIFTTHATVIGRCIAGNGLPLYEPIATYNGDQKAREFNVVAKQSLEKIAAQTADAFTTVSEITAVECAQFLEKNVDLVTPNGFDDAFVPSNDVFAERRQAARKQLLAVAAAVCNEPDLPKDSLIVATSGRYEFRNKGIDLYLQSLLTLNEHSQDLARPVVAFVMVPAGNSGVKKEVLDRLQHGSWQEDNPPSVLTHNLYDPDNDPVLRTLTAANFQNSPSNKVKIVFVPTYLNGADGLFNCPYYDLLIGCDLTVFPSYYEPWGYTPLESLAFAVPTITTSLAGFGRWVQHKLAGEIAGIKVVHRTDTNEAQVVSEMMQHITEFTQKTEQELYIARETARNISRIALWKNLVANYFDAYQIALGKVAHREDTFSMPTQRHLPSELGEPLTNKPKWKRILVQSYLPETLMPLKHLSDNLWWCWQKDAIDLFANINPKLWQQVESNPIALLDQLSFNEYSNLANNPHFMERLHTIYARFEAYITTPKLPNSPQIAYFCMEYGLHSSVRLYSGGLGILAGDYLKEASDTNTDLVGVGLLYRYGYFTQHLSHNGEQIAQYDAQRFSYLPAQPVKDEAGNWIHINIPLPGRLLYAKIWCMNVGRVKLYLLDTDITENSEDDRKVTYQLYGGDWEMRLKQEMLLGIGGVRMLEALNIRPNLYHLNEGHAAFSTIERLNHSIQTNNLFFDEALEVVRGSSLFTTHTPVPAGHDAFTEDLLRAYLSNYDNDLNISWQQFMGLGRLNEWDGNEKFSMSHLAARTCQEINGVSRIHGNVSKQMFNDLWQGYNAEELHIGYVTNGVHYPTWIASEWHELYTQTFGDGFLNDQANKDYWRKIYHIDDEVVWKIRTHRRRILMDYIRLQIAKELTKRQRNPREIVALTQAITDNALVIGFARRFATYKRAELLFYNPDRLAKIVNNAKQPIVFVFAGKAHPADKAGQDLIKRVVDMSEKPEFLGKVIFLENYDMQLAHLLVQGVDVWLNTPTRPLEASGTSGMKATLNGVLNFSVLDGWWAEGYRPDAGWALKEERTYQDQEHQNQLDSETIYGILENDMLPLFYQRNTKGLPVAWIQFVKQAIAEIAPQFTTKRMIDDYKQRFYSKLFERTQWLNENEYEQARNLAAWKRKVRRNWEQIAVLDTQLPDTSNHALNLGDTFSATISLNIAELNVEDIGIEVLFIVRKDETSFNIVRNTPLKAVSQKGNIATYECHVQANESGVYDYGFRIYPKNTALPYKEDIGLVRWI